MLLAWFRLNANWDRKGWLYKLEPDVRLAWVSLLCHAKMEGVRGVIEALDTYRASIEWRIPERAVCEMVAAAFANGSIVVDGDCWEIPGWATYQPQDSMTQAERAKKYRALRKNVTRRDGRDGALRDVIRHAAPVSVTVVRDGTEPQAVEGTEGTDGLEWETLDGGPVVSGRSPSQAAVKNLQPTSPVDSGRTRARLRTKQ